MEGGYAFGTRYRYLTGAAYQIHETSMNSAIFLSGANSHEPAAFIKDGVQTEINW